MKDYTSVSSTRMADPFPSQAGPSKPPSKQQNVFLPQKRKVQNEHDNPATSFKKTKTSQATSVNESISFKGKRMPGGLIINPVSTGATGKGKGKQREIVPPTREEIEADEDVQRMNVEREKLRDREVRAQAQATNLQSTILPSSPSFWNKAGPGQSTPLQEKVTDITQPLPMRDTPLIDKNRAMRRETVDRRTSLSRRGKRASSSFENKGIIPKPHTSLSPSNFHKHIDRELPEAYRARQLIAWCASKAAAGVSSSSGSSRSQPLPPLTAEGARMLKEVQNEVYKMLEEQRIEISFTTRMDKDGRKTRVRPNEQNQKNKQREDDFQRYISRCEREGETWNSVIQTYNARKSSSLDTLARQRKISITPDWAPPDTADPYHDREVEGSQLARRCIEHATRKRGGSPITLRMAEVENKIDRIHAVVHVADQAANHLLRYLDMRFKVLSTALALRGQPLRTAPDHGLTLSRLVSSESVPSTSGSAGLPDTMAILRALARTDVEQPRQEMTDEARKAARDVQRVNATPGRNLPAAGSSTERRLTAVTPRSGQATPRRPGTPRQRNDGHGSS